jgi:RecJ-like exonuclease
MEEQAKATEVKKSKTKRESRVPCLQCGVMTNLNAYETCLKCRTKACKDCGANFMVNKNRFDRCSECQRSRRKRLSRNQGF